MPTTNVINKTLALNKENKTSSEKPNLNFPDQKANENTNFDNVKTGWD